MKKITELERWNKGLKGKEKIAFDALLDKEKRCSSSLNFGTAGVRGVMGLGSAHINEWTITKIVVAFAQLLKVGERVLVSFDTRKNSKKYAKLVQKILLCKQIECISFKKATPTSVLAFNVKKQGFDYGIMITSSHNPKEYNGFKIIAKNGGQISDKFASQIMKNAQKVNEFEEYYNIKNIKPKRNFAPKSYYKDFLDLCYSVSIVDEKPLINICYTPLNGTGLYLAKKILKHNKYAFTVPPKHKKKDGEFKTCPYPNPEFNEAYVEAEKWSGENVDIIIATDPDADRLGVKVRDKNNNFVLLSGNEVGLLLLKHKLDRRKEDSFVVSTVVSSPMVEKMCKKANVDLHLTLTGFKNITDKIENTKGKVLLAFEESCGYIVHSYLRDKDGLSAMSLIAEIANDYYRQNKTLLDALEELYAKYGYEISLNQSIEFKGEEGKLKIQQILEKLRSEKLPKTILGVTDYLDSEKTKLPKSNFLGYELKNGRLFIRPSGTEPKLKLYVYGYGKTRQEAVTSAQAILVFAKELIK